MYTFLALVLFSRSSGMFQVVIFSRIVVLLKFLTMIEESTVRQMYLWVGMNLTYKMAFLSVFKFV